MAITQFIPESTAASSATLENSNIPTILLESCPWDFRNFEMYKKVKKPWKLLLSPLIIEAEDKNLVHNITSTLSLLFIC